MSREYKNRLPLRENAYGPERRKNLTKEILSDSSPLPNPLEYKDIDEEFRRWATEDLSISYEGERIPTYALYSNQRFSEYMQSWANVDDKKNLVLNFKTITRENNPKSGTIVGDTRNIPGNPSFLMKRVEAYDKNNRKYYIDYKVKQPIAIDLSYTVSIVTNKYELINEFNQMVNEKFKSIDCYIRPKGHFIPMKLNDISDESEYSIDNRQFYSQSYNITVMGYIMPKDSFSVEERGELKLVGFEEDENNTFADIEEYPCDYNEECPYKYSELKLTMNFDICHSSIKFKMDTDFHIDKSKEGEPSPLTLTNIRENGYSIYVNDVKLETGIDENFEVKNGDEIKIKSVKRLISNKESSIVIKGYNSSNVIKKEDDIETKEITYSIE